MKTNFQHVSPKSIGQPRISDTKTIHSPVSHSPTSLSVNPPSAEITTPSHLIGQITASHNRFSTDQLHWLDHSLCDQLSKAPEASYQCSDTKPGIHRPQITTNDTLPNWAPSMSHWFEGKTILVTGSSGFIGKYAIEALNKRGANKIIGIDTVTPTTALRQTHKNFIPYQVDILNKDAMTKIFEACRPDGVIHLAAKAGVPQAEASDAAAQSYFDTNVKGTDVIAGLCHDFNVSFLANAGSSSEFGSQAWDNHQLIPQSERNALVPEGNYGRTKVFSEMLLSARALGHASADHTLVTTFFNPIGTGERGLLVPLMTRRLLDCAAGQGDPFTVFDQYRGYTPVEQTLEHLFRGAERLIDAGPDQAPLDYIHCGGGISTNNKDIARMATDALNAYCAEKGKFKNIDFSALVKFDDVGSREGDVKATYSDATKASETLGLTPDKQALAASIEKTVREVADIWFSKQATSIAA